jgi:hypothetical protein
MEDVYGWIILGALALPILFGIGMALFLLTLTMLAIFGGWPMVHPPQSESDAGSSAAGPNPSEGRVEYIYLE